MKNSLVIFLSLIILAACSERYILAHTYPGEHLPVKELFSNTTIIIEMQIPVDVDADHTKKMDEKEHMDLNLRNIVKRSLFTDYMFATKEQYEMLSKDKYRFVVKSMETTQYRYVENKSNFGSMSSYPVLFVKYYILDRQTDKVYYNHEFPKTSALRYFNIYITKMNQIIKGVNKEKGKEKYLRRKADKNHGYVEPVKSPGI